MANLYEVNQQLLDAIDFSVDPETGEFLEGQELEQKVNELHIALADKMENIAKYIKNLDADVEAFKDEQKKLMARRKTIENKKAWLEKYLNSFIRGQHQKEDGSIDEDKLNKFKFETPSVKITYRKSSSIQITDLSKVPKKFLKVHERELDDVKKSEIGKFLKEQGLTESKYAEIVNNVNMSVK